MELTKEEFAEYEQSNEIECPKCRGFVYIRAFFSPDSEYGDTIQVEAYCPNCKDQRVDSLSEFTYNLRDLANKIGS